MITVEQAQHAVAPYSDDDLCALVAAVLLRRHSLPSPGPSFEAQPEDFFIPLLRERFHPRRAPVLRGTIQLLGKVASFLVDTTQPIEGEMRAALDHLSALISLAEPPELEDPMLLLVEFALAHPALDAKLRPTLLRAAMTYARPGADPALWERCLRDLAFAGYGVEALLRIDPDAERIDEALLLLWRRFISGGSTVIAAELTRRIVQARGTDAFLTALFARLVAELPAEEATLRAELDSRPYSQPWLQYLPGERKPRRWSALRELAQMLDDAFLAARDTLRRLPRTDLAKLLGWAVLAVGAVAVAFAPSDWVRLFAMLIVFILLLFCLALADGRRSFASHG
jgi:hypothetical protein